VEVQLDERFMALGAALAASSQDTGRSEHRLASATRQRLSGFADHDVVKWLWEQVRKYEFLTLAMQLEQLGGPPDFAPRPSSEAPPFVDEYFSMIPRDKVSQGLAVWWRVAEIAELLRSQRPQWEVALQDVVSVLGQVNLEEFQVRFFGRFPYRAIIVPVVNVPFVGAQAVGVSTNSETRAICFPYGDSTYGEHPFDLMVVAQHEASHVMVDLVQRLHPAVTGECLFVEEACPPSGRFLSGYGDPGFRFVETLIRASSYFFLQWLGMESEAESFLGSQLAAGVSGIGAFVRALRPWWNLRVEAKAAGLDAYFPRIPSELRRAVSA